MVTVEWNGEKVDDLRAMRPGVGKEKGRTGRTGVEGGEGPVGCGCLAGRVA